MVVKTIQDNIFNSDLKHIAFAINVEGLNDSVFAGQVSRCYWPELSRCGEHAIGTVLSKKVGEKTFHALVCHSLHNDCGTNQSEIIKECFDKIPANDELIATIAIGTGFIGTISGVNFRQIVCGMHDSIQKIVLYAGFSLEEVSNCYNYEKKKKDLTKEKKLML